MDLISGDSRRWTLAHPEIPQRTGKINNVNKFDASFFGVHYKQAHTMDPMCRILLEKAYEAVIDAGELNLNSKITYTKSLFRLNSGIIYLKCTKSISPTLKFLIKKWINVGNSKNDTIAKILNLAIRYLIFISAVSFFIFKEFM